MIDRATEVYQHRIMRTENTVFDDQRRSSLVVHGEGEGGDLPTQCREQRRSDRLQGSTPVGEVPSSIRGVLALRIPEAVKGSLI